MEDIALDHLEMTPGAFPTHHVPKGDPDGSSITKSACFRSSTMGE